MGAINKIRLKIMTFDGVGVLDLSEQNEYLSWLYDEVGRELAKYWQALSEISYSDWKKGTNFRITLEELQTRNRRRILSGDERYTAENHLAQYIFQSQYALTEQFLHNFSGKLHCLRLLDSICGFNVADVDFSYCDLSLTDISAKQTTMCKSIHRAIIPAMVLDEVDFTGKDISQTRFSHCYTTKSEWYKGAINIDGVIPPHVHIP